MHTHTPRKVVLLLLLFIYANRAITIQFPGPEDADISPYDYDEIFDGQAVSGFPADSYSEFPGQVRNADIDGQRLEALYADDESKLTQVEGSNDVTLPVREDKQEEEEEEEEEEQQIRSLEAVDEGLDITLTATQLPGIPQLAHQMIIAGQVSASPPAIESPTFLTSIEVSATLPAIVANEVISDGPSLLIMRNPEESPSAATGSVTPMKLENNMLPTKVAALLPFLAGLPQDVSPVHFKETFVLEGVNSLSSEQLNMAEKEPPLNYKAPEVFEVAPTLATELPSILNDILESPDEDSGNIAIMTARPLVSIHDDSFISQKHSKFLTEGPHPLVPEETNPFENGLDVPANVPRQEYDNSAPIIVTSPSLENADDQALIADTITGEATTAMFLETSLADPLTSYQPDVTISNPVVTSGNLIFDKTSQGLIFPSYESFASNRQSTEALSGVEESHRDNAIADKDEADHENLNTANDKDSFEPPNEIIGVVANPLSGNDKILEDIQDKESGHKSRRTEAADESYLNHLTSLLGHGKLDDSDPPIVELPDMADFATVADFFHSQQYLAEFRRRVVMDSHALNSFVPEQNGKTYTDDGGSDITKHTDDIHQGTSDRTLIPVPDAKLNLKNDEAKDSSQELNVGNDHLIQDIEGLDDLAHEAITAEELKQLEAEHERRFQAVDPELLHDSTNTKNLRFVPQNTIGERGIPQLEPGLESRVFKRFDSASAPGILIPLWVVLAFVIFLIG